MTADSLIRELRSELAEAGVRAEDALLALGHGGDRRVRLAAAMRALLRHRRPDATICPSDAARAVGGEEWRDVMDAARDVAAELARDGVITVRQRGAEVDIAAAVGPVRLGCGPAWITGTRC
ncbi:DUF3253 domain-containing protein [Couchioplanes caeruleus]|uniref:DUF3253 domain-containing protein n=1 Tax=Couchioplanes caeruleus TaxID=56438 RepID=UPI0020C183D8|nr:DUF3253 domain-containing protein [Couchioplanes caeruleus]UQU65810.1 DUF3253 domain-containing protein [Couchioplanes caeruleus]